MSQAGTFGGGGGAGGSGSLELNYTLVNTTPYVVQPNETYLAVDASSGPMTIQLPDIAKIKKCFVIKDQQGTASTNNITITTPTGGTNIDLAFTFVMNTDFESVVVIGNGFGYEIW